MSNIWHVHNDPDLWPDSRRFDPERYLDENGRFVKSNKVIPFSIGPRSCLGENFARIDIFLFIYSILQISRFFPTTTSLNRAWKEPLNLCIRHFIIWWYLKRDNSLHPLARPRSTLHYFSLHFYRFWSRGSLFVTWWVEEEFEVL